MRKLSLLILVVLIFSSAVKAQDPIQWSFTAKKLSGTRYQVELIASIKSGWHLYSQTQPAEAIALPTNIQFKKHPLIDFKGSVKEQGKLKKVKDETLGVESWQFAGKVRFVQVVELKNNVKTNISGSVEFQACTDEKCLPPKTVDFSIALTE